jgi:enoyl-CoA hydratase
MTDAAIAEGDLIARKEGSAGILRLNRPKANNAVTLEMFHDIDKALDVFEADPTIAVILLEGAGERGLCAGGDIRALWESSKVRGDLGKILWRDEYILNARTKKFPKPYVAFMDGIVMGGGVGLSAHASHRVVTDKTKLAMPEVGLGFFPDVGGTWLLSHSPGEIGTYFGLTGQTMNGPDAIHAKFADAVVPSAKLPALREALTKVAPGATSADVRKLIDGFSTGEKAGPVAAQQATIDALFAHDRMEDIVAALQRDGSEFAQTTLKTLNEKSPRGMVVTLKLLRLARTASSLEECLVREYRAALEVFASDDFREGVRAAVIDKDRNPKWAPPRIEDVTPDMVAPYFAERTEQSQAEDSRWQTSHSLASAIWVGRWRPIWSRQATRSPRSIWSRPRATRPRLTEQTSPRVRRLP